MLMQISSNCNSFVQVGPPLTTIAKCQLYKHLAIFFFSRYKYEKG